MLYALSDILYILDLISSILYPLYPRSYILCPQFSLEMLLTHLHASGHRAQTDYRISAAAIKPEPKPVDNAGMLVRERHMQF